MKISVTGSGGFIGSHSVEGFRNKSYEVIPLGIIDSKWIRDIIKADITNSEDIKRVLLLERPDVVFHCAGKVNRAGGLDVPFEDLMVNVGGTINILEGMRKIDCNKIIFTSSSTLYGDTHYQSAKETHKKTPLLPYSLNKLLSEEYIKFYSRLYGIKYVILRYARVYGPRQYHNATKGVPTIFIDDILRGERPKVYGDGSQTRDFVYISDVVEANIMALSWENKTVNIATQTEVSALELLNIIKRILKSDIEPEFLPKRKYDLERFLVDISLAKELGWKPKVSLEEGLTETINWYRSEMGL